MTTAIKQRIAISAAALIEELKFDVASLCAFAPLPVDTDEDKCDQLDQKLELLELHIANHEQPAGQLKDALAEFTNLCKKLTDDARIAAETDHAALMNQLKIDKILQASTARETELYTARANLRLEQKRIKRKIGTSQAQQQSKVILPPTKMPEFHGSPETWSEFWAAFEQAIDANNALSPATKHTYLSLAVQGSAKELIAGLPLDGSQYGTALRILKAKFGDAEQRIKQLKKELRSLPFCHNLEEQNRFAINLEKIARQLETLHIDIESSDFSEAIEEKLFVPMLQAILIAKKKEGDSWNTTKLREVLAEQLELQNELTSIKAVRPKNPNKPEKRKSTEPNTAQPAATLSNVSSSGNANQSNKKRRSKKKGGNNSAPQSNTGTASQQGSQSQRQIRNPPSPCMFCSEAHWASECTVYNTAEGRHKRAVQLNLCLRCLSNRHATDACKNTRLCILCKGQHPKALCTKQNVATGSNTVIPKFNGAAISNANHVLLDTIYAQIANPAHIGSAIKAGIFIDKGSQPSLISAEKAKQLQLTPIDHEQLTVRGLGLHTNSYEPGRVRFDLQTKSGEISIEAFVVPPEHFPPLLTIPVEELQLSEEVLQSVPLTAITQVMQPDVLIGNEYWHQLHFREEKQLPSGFWLNNSVLGLMLDGKGTLASTCASIVPIVNNTIVHDEDEDFLQKAKRFFETDTLGNEDEKSASEVDAQVHEKFRQDLQLRDGRYFTGIPFKPELINLLPSNYALARARLNSVLKKLREKPELLHKCHAIMQEQAETGIIEKAPREPEGPVHYLPHHPVVKPDSGKVRIVFAGNARENKKALALNDVVHQGPTLLNDLSGIEMRFRLHPVGIICDIKGAFLQVGLLENSRDATRFLWPENPEDQNSPIKVWRFQRVTFGLNCSPFHLAATVNEHLDKTNSLVAQKIKHDIYVDNIVTGVDHESQTLKLCQEMIEIFQKAKMELREFASNDWRSLNSLPPEIRLTGMASGQIVKVLGISWDTHADTFRFKLPEPSDKPLTKRSALSQMASCFDPLGLISPLLLSAKRFLQKLWLDGKNWDEALSAKEIQDWEDITKHWKPKREMCIPRRYFDWPLKKCTDFQLHTFADASLSGLGFAVYLRASNGKQTKTSLVFARSKLISALKNGKKATVPRYELEALSQSIKATELVKRELGLNFSIIQLWTDSLIAIKWLKGEEQKDIYIRNRLKKLTQWHVRHVPTAYNPADVASRGVNHWDDLIKNDCWFDGPIWLKNEPENWPDVIKNNLKYIPGEKEELEEKDETFFSVSAAATQAVNLPIFLYDASRISTWHYSGAKFRTRWQKIKMIHVFIFRFMRIKVFDKCEKLPPFAQAVCNVALPLKNCEFPTAEELELAENFIFWESQSQFPPNESLQKSLDMQIDNQDIFRCIGRLENSELCPFAKYPVYVPKEAPLAKVLAEHAHAVTHHAGTNTALAKLRQTCWIPSGRRTINSIKCYFCLRDKAKPYTALPHSALPASRVKRVSPWQNIGMDNFGPMYVTNKKKVWGTIFTCQVTRAVHIELVESCSAEDFLSALRRFIALRRLPAEIITDNGTNFTASAKALQTIWGEVMRHPHVQSHSALNGIKWTFITEASPWRGGFYERLIGIVKSALKRSIGRCILTKQELTTLLYEISATINERPLIPHPDKPEWILRPIDLLRLDIKGVTTLPEYEVSDPLDPDYQPGQKTGTQRLIEAFNKAVAKLERFWTIWHEQYLLSLRERQQKFIKAGSKIFPRVGSVVLVHEKLGRNDWRLAKILELPSERTAVILMNGHKTRRPINLLYPLELEQDERSFEQISAVATMADEILLLDDDMDFEEPRPLQNYRIPKGPPKVRPEYRKEHEERLKSKVVVVVPGASSRKRSRSPRRSQHKNRGLRSPPRQDRRSSPHRSRSRFPNRSLTKRGTNVRFGSSTHRSNWSLTTREQQQQQIHQIPVLPTPNGWKMDEICEPNKGNHKECIRIDVKMVAEVFRNFELLVNVSDHVQGLYLPTLLQQILCGWLFHWQNGKHRNLEPEDIMDFLYRLSLAKTKDDALAAWENIAIVGRPHYHNRSGDWHFPLMEKVLALHGRCCKIAESTLSKDNWMPIARDQLTLHGTLPHGIEAAENLPRRLSDSLTELRGKLFWDGSELAKTRILFIGDQTVADYAEGIEGAHRKVVTIEKLPTTIPASVFLTLRTEVIIVWIGKEMLMKGHSSTFYRERMYEFLENMKKFGRKIFILAPPYIGGTNKQRIRDWDEICYLIKVIEQRFPLAKGIIASCSTKGDQEQTDGFGNLTRIGVEKTDAKLNEMGLQITRRAPKGSSGQQLQQEPGPSHSRVNKTGSIVGRLSITSQFSMTTLTGLLFLMCFVMPNAAVNVYWCPQKETTIWDLNQTVNCAHKPTASWINASIDIWEENLTPIPIQAHFCSIRLDNVTVYENLFGDVFTTRNDTRFLEIVKAECLLMKENHRCGQQTMVNKTGIWQTENPVQVPKASYWQRLVRADINGSAINCFAHSTTAYADRKNLQLTIPGAVRKSHCLANNTFCMVQGGIVIWEQASLNSCRYTAVKRNWTGQFNFEQKVWRDKEKDFVLTFQNPISLKNCEAELILSDQGIAIPAQMFNQWMKVRSRRSLATEESTAAGDTAGYFDLIEELNSTIQAIQSKDCIRRREKLANLHEEFASNPTGAARLLFKREDVQARWAAKSVLETWPCISVSLNNFRFRATGNICYKILPVSGKLIGKSWLGFLNTRSMILSSHSETGPCDEHAIHYIRNGNELLAIDQRIAKRPAHTLPMRKWSEHLKFDFPQLKTIVFHSVLHTPTEILLPGDHLEDAQQWQQQRGTQPVLQSSPSANLEPINIDILGPTTKLLVDFSLKVRFVWVTACCTKVTFDILIFLIALVVKKVKAKLGWLGEMENAEQPTRKRWKSRKGKLGKRVPNLNPNPEEDSESSVSVLRRDGHGKRAARECRESH